MINITEINYVLIDRVCYDLICIICATDLPIINNFSGYEPLESGHTNETRIFTHTEEILLGNET